MESNTLHVPKDIEYCSNLSHGWAIALLEPTPIYERPYTIWKWKLLIGSRGTQRTLPGDDTDPDLKGMDVMERTVACDKLRDS
jgi:hypothetical protein